MANPFPDESPLTSTDTDRSIIRQDRIEDLDRSKHAANPCIHYPRSDISSSEEDGLGMKLTNVIDGNALITLAACAIVFTHDQEIFYRLFNHFVAGSI